MTTAKAYKGLPMEGVIATHMDSLDHAMVSRQTLREYAEANGVRPEQLRIPLDGKRIIFAGG